MRHTKIVATLGPASSSDEAIRALIDAGVDVFRLNFSHGDHATHGAVITRVRAAAATAGRCIAILQDLSGPKIRTGRLRDGQPLALRPGDTLTIGAGDFAGEPGRISTTYAPLLHSLKTGDTLLLDDGHIQLRVERTGKAEVVTSVVDGGTLGEHKGINAPGVALGAGLTEKDRADLLFGIKAGVDLVALSFVEQADDLRHVRAVAREAGAPDLPLVAKLERPQAIANIEAILHAADAVMVARGDLGLELPLEQVPRIQKAVTRRARALGIPVIVATQVLESMRDEPRPTRAEVSDAANAVDDRVDAIMLAGETAAGKYPIAAVQMLDRIIREAESIPPSGAVPLEEAQMKAPHGRAICEAAVTLATRGDAAAIVAVTQGGHTAHVLSAFRPAAPIFAATPSPEIGRRLALTWGVVPVVADSTGDAPA
jgi:pyruvate kinase